MLAHQHDHVTADNYGKLKPEKCFAAHAGHCTRAGEGVEMAMCAVTSDQPDIPRDIYSYVTGYRNTHLLVASQPIWSFQATNSRGELPNPSIFPHINDGTEYAERRARANLQRGRD